ncbi:septum formation initiator [Nocardioides sp. Root1257]|uniref:FtsB family cell division protein n=1 Tax=unclassified Nocardioides TaxID=2615069 RepID=UPI0006F80E86|nr:MULTISPECIES: septum formation initiator family protein [unclassified Nocardioides]KQW48874.1 septum formation initiator [Nocardioides sp. Root1257]KRC48049.1 septum formation initiator [Nocardioides sp. Root224]
MPESRRTPSRAPRPGGRPGRGRSGSTGRGSTRSSLTDTSGTGSLPAVPVGRRRPRVTGRAAVLLLVLSLLTISYASSMRAYLDQRSHIDDLKGQIALRQARIDDLEREKRRWDDPAFVRQQARDLNYVMPGETAYVVLDEDGKPLDSEAKLSDPAEAARKAPTAWWSTAWKSVELAGNPPKPGDKPQPADKIDETP